MAREIPHVRGDEASAAMPSSSPPCAGLALYDERNRASDSADRLVRLDPRRRR
jgi:hypothetical protein